MGEQVGFHREVNVSFSSGMFLVCVCVGRGVGESGTDHDHSEP